MSGQFGRTITGGGTDNLSQTGYLASEPYNSTPATNYTVTENGNYLSGAINFTETGLDRNGVLVYFSDPSNTDAANGPGNLDYSPVGSPIHVGASPYWGPSPSGNITAAATDAAFHEIGLELLHEYCFVAGIKAIAKNGARLAIEEIHEGDVLLASPDHSPERAADEKHVEKTFRRERAHVIQVHAGDLIIGVTPEHSIYVVGDGRREAGRLNPGDLLLQDDGSTIAVTKVVDNGEMATVYNVQVADHHTYFIGNGGRGVLVHNQSAGWTKFWGGVKVAGGLDQAAGGVAFAAATRWTGVGVVGGGLVAAKGRRTRKRAILLFTAV